MKNRIQNTEDRRQHTDNQARQALNRDSGAESPNPNEQVGKARPGPHSLLLREGQDGRGRNSQIPQYPPFNKGGNKRGDSLRDSRLRHAGMTIAEGSCLAGKKHTIISVVIFSLLIFSNCTKISSSENDSITFSHKFHLEQGLECLNCHDGIQQSEAAGFGLPSMDVCTQCHTETQDSEQCIKCHSNPSTAKKLALRAINLNFSHKSHMERVNNDCTACHTTNATSTQVKDDNIPSMDSCTNCHSATIREMKCSQCHANLGSYELKPITHMSHKGNFIKQHQEFASADVSVCAQCHQESFCSDCHAKTEGVKASIKFPEFEHRTFIHRGDWLSRHPLEARADQNSCLKCHDLNRCRDCHEKTSAEPARSKEAGHPEGWGNPASPDFHGKVARRDIVLCAACHDQGEKSICVTCHNAQISTVNIHPKGFKSSLDKNKDKMCTVCHK